jgi:transcription elongation factor GreA
MPGTTTAASRRHALTARLAQLQADRDNALAEVIPEGSGDSADRATNVDARIRLEMLEQRIASVESELSAPPVRRPADGRVAEGDLVTVDLGDGPETFLLASIEQADDGARVITPGSPLGQALLGAAVGARVHYVAGSRRTLQATVVALG